MIVTIQQAACNAFAVWLRTQMPGIPVEARWPSPDFQKPLQSISIVTAGPRRDIPIDLGIVNATKVGSTQTNATWQIAAATQPLQLDLWATSDPARDDMLARLDQILYSGDASLTGQIAPYPGAGNLIRVQDGWQTLGTIADFVFEDPGLDVSSDLIGRALYRATLRGNAYFMITVQQLTARQITQNFYQYIGESDLGTAPTG